MCVKAILLWAAAGQFIKSEEAINNVSTCVVFVCVHSFWLGYWAALCQSLRSHREMAQSFSPTASSAPTSPITNLMWPQGRYSARVVQHLKQHSTSNSYQLLLNWIFAVEQNTVHSAVCVPDTGKRGDLSSSQPSTGCTRTTLLCELCSGSCKQVKLFISLVVLSDLTPSATNHSLTISQDSHMLQWHQAISEARSSTQLLARGESNRPF